MPPDAPDPDHRPATEQPEMPPAVNQHDTEEVQQLRPEPRSRAFATDRFPQPDDDATELHPDDTEPATETRTQTENTGGSLYPGKLQNVRAPGWDQSAARPRGDLEQRRHARSADSAPELHPSSAPNLHQATPELRPAQTHEQKNATPAPHRRRDEFRSVNEAAKELARAALQAEIEREEKRALQSYEPEEGEIPPSPEVAKRFDVILQLGRGGMAVVYLCRDPRRAGRVFAVKDIRAEMKPGMKIEERVEHEAKLLKELDHPGIVKVYDLLKFTRGSAIVMEYIDGLPLDHEIGAGRRITWDFGMRILREIGLALQYAHDHGVIHRDIKPDNILYSERHSIMKLVDFGLARIYGEEPDVHMTRTGMVVGTPHYMSPEQVSGKPLDQRSDIYSFGATLYYLLTGQRHVAGSNVMDILEQQRSKDIVPPSHVQRDIPAWVSYIIGKMMEIKPDARYSDMAAVLRDLDAAESDPEAFLDNPPLGPVKRYGGAELAPFSAEHDYHGSDPEIESLAVSNAPERATSRVSARQRRTTHRTSDQPAGGPEDAPDVEISAMLREISTRLERTEQRMVSPGALVLIVMLSTLVVVLLLIGLLLFAAREGYLERLIYL